MDTTSGSRPRALGELVREDAGQLRRPAPRQRRPSLGTVDVVGSLMARIEVQTVMDWIFSVAEVLDGPLVSVTTATRNRPGLFTEAIESVFGQSYQRSNW